MKLKTRLLFGLVGAVVFCLGVTGLALLVPGYSHVRQTISEIGEAGSPLRLPFAILLCIVAACLLFFASAIREITARSGHSQIAGNLIGFFALAEAGLAMFATPDPIHLDLGISSLIGFQAPLALAITWRRDPKQKGLVKWSWFLALIIWLTAILGLSSLESHSSLWMVVAPVYGIVQRMLFGAWFGWCSLTAVLLWRSERKKELADSRS